MSDGLDKRRQALEDSYFQKEDERKIAELTRKGTGQRLSPITGKPMIREVINNVTVDRCVDSNGLWLDAGELDELIKRALEEVGQQESTEESWLTTFFTNLLAPGTDEKKNG
jgi:hypothetical protein